MGRWLRGARPDVQAGCKQRSCGRPGSRRDSGGTTCGAGERAGSRGPVLDEPGLKASSVPSCTPREEGGLAGPSAYPDRVKATHPPMMLRRKTVVVRFPVKPKSIAYRGYVARTGSMRSSFNPSIKLCNVTVATAALASLRRAPASSSPNRHRASSRFQRSGPRGR